MEQKFIWDLTFGTKKNLTRGNVAKKMRKVQCLLQTVQFFDKSARNGDLRRSESVFWGSTVSSTFSLTWFAQLGLKKDFIFAYCKCSILIGSFKKECEICCHLVISKTVKILFYWLKALRVSFISRFNTHFDVWAKSYP